MKSAVAESLRRGLLVYRVLARVKGIGESHLSFTFGSTFLILATFIFKKSGFFFRLLFDVLGFFFQKKLFFFKKNTIFGSNKIVL